MIALVPFALATTLTLERTDKGGLSWEIAAEEGWKVGRDPEPEVRIDLVGAEGSTAIDVPAKGAMGPQILQLLPDLEQLQVRARLQVCREDLCDAKQGLSGVLARAGDAGVPALVVLGGRGCKPCAELAHDVLFAEGDPAKLSGRVEWALLNMMDAGIADQLKAWGLPISMPTLLIVRADGTLVAQHSGYGGREPFEKWLRGELRQGR